MTTFIGDVHGKYAPYKKLIKDRKDTIQVGDMGVGFSKISFEGVKYLSNPPYDQMSAGNHRFIRGNHDNPAICKHHKYYISDGTIEGDMMFVGGGLSIDKELRTEGIDYWSTEELSIQELNDMVDKYIEAKPKIMVTHDCPEDVGQYMQAISGRGKLNYPSRTRQAFQSMFSAHSPDVWVFGHWHHSFDAKVNGTRFICLAELECKTI